MRRVAGRDVVASQARAHAAEVEKAHIAWVPLAATLVIAITIAGLWIAARAYGFLVCDMDCGETLLALRAGEQFALHGVRFGLLEALGPDDRPQIYTHSVNIGALTFILLETLGVQSFAAKALLPLAAYGLGLFYVFLTVRRVTASDLAALVTLVVFATAYWGLGAFAFNALRAWHLVAFFAVAFHAGSLIGVDRRLRLPHVAGLVFGAVVAFGCGYDFWIICGAVAICQIMLALPSWRALLPALLVTAVIFAAPFVLRQLQVIAALGAPYWWQDFLYTLAIKIPHASRIIHLPPQEELDAWYRAHNVLRPPASATNSFVEIFYTFRHMLAFVTLPRWGWLGLITLPMIMAVALMPACRGSLPGLVGARLIWPMMLGMAAGVTALAPFSLHVYFKHEFPLFAFPLLLAKGAALAWLVRVALAPGRRRVAATAATAVFAIDAAMVHHNNTVTGLYNNVGWTEFVRRNPNAEFLLATYQPSHSRQMPAVDGLKVTFIGAQEAQAALQAPKDSATPRFLVYQPTDQVVDFDAPVPRCVWREWITTLLTPSPPRSERVSCIYGFPLPPTATPQPSLDEMSTLGHVVERSMKGIGYLIFALK